jgi:hypothetical protein
LRPGIFCRGVSFGHCILKRHILFPVVATGLLAGFAIASIIWPVHSRAERLSDLFADYCLPHHHGEDVTAKAEANLVLHKRTSSSTHWIDQVSGSFLELGKRSCLVTTYHPFALSAPDALELLDLTAAIVAEEFPELPVDPKATMGPESLSKGWLSGKVQSPERWGVFFWAYPDLGKSSGSSISLYSTSRETASKENSAGSQ